MGKDAVATTTPPWHTLEFALGLFWPGCVTAEYNARTNETRLKLDPECGVHAGAAVSEAIASRLCVYAVLAWLLDQQHIEVTFGRHKYDVTITVVSDESPGFAVNASSERDEPGEFAHALFDAYTAVRARLDERQISEPAP